MQQDGNETQKLIRQFQQQAQEEADREVSRKREQEEASMKVIRDMLADDGVSQDRIASSINDQSEETDRRSRNEAIMGYDGADQSGSATATSTRSRRCGQPEPVVVVQSRVVRDINNAARVKYFTHYVTNMAHFMIKLVIL